MSKSTKYNYGKSKTYDSTVVKEVRMRTLGDILEVLNETENGKNFSQFKKDMLLKLATTVLPRINELSGREGEAIKIEGVNISFKKYNNGDK